jgi:hypothetical protein
VDKYDSQAFESHDEFIKAFLMWTIHKLDIIDYDFYYNNCNPF